MLRFNQNKLKKHLSAGSCARRNSKIGVVSRGQSQQWQHHMPQEQKKKTVLML